MPKKKDDEVLKDAQQITLIDNPKINSETIRAVGDTVEKIGQSAKIQAGMFATGLAIGWAAQKALREGKLKDAFKNVGLVPDDEQKLERPSED